MLDTGRPGLFREHMLPSIPMGEVDRYFDETFGRLTKGLNAMIGALILQQRLHLTDEEAVQQFVSNLQWHYALNITEEPDSAKYISLKTLWNLRNIVSSHQLEKEIFSASTMELTRAFNGNTDKQRLYSVYINSNMRRLSRIGIFSESIHKFLVNLKKGRRDQFDTVDEKIVERYMAKSAMGCFSRVKPSESKKTLAGVSRAIRSIAAVPGLS